METARGRSSHVDSLCACTNSRTPFALPVVQTFKSWACSRAARVTRPSRSRCACTQHCARVRSLPEIFAASGGTHAVTAHSGS